MPKDSLWRVEALAAQLKNTAPMIEFAGVSAAEEVVNLVKDGFRTETDPYGERWEKKKRRDGRKTLSGPTSRLKNGWHVSERSPEGFKVSPAVNYALPHQNPRRKGGKLKRPRRMMVPSTEKGLPPEWARQIEEAVQEAMGDALSFRGGGLLRGAGGGAQGALLNRLMRSAGIPSIGGRRRSLRSRAGMKITKAVRIDRAMVRRTRNAIETEIRRRDD